MSYILDALRKADAERERGSVPGLHTHVPPVPADAPAARHGVPPAWVAAGSAVVVAGALAWAYAGRSGEPVPMPPVEPAAPPVVATAPSPAPVAAPAAEPAVPAPAAPVTSTPAPAAAPPAPVTAPPHPVATAPSPVPAPAPSRQAAAKHATTVAAKPAAKPAAPPAPVASAPEARVYTVSELPEAVRREWPQLSVGGSIYSETPASRFLIINGQIYHEGDKIGSSGMSLEQIKLKAAVLLYKGYRVGITY